MKTIGFSLFVALMFLATIMGVSAETISIDGNISYDSGYNSTSCVSSGDPIISSGSACVVGIEYDLNFSIPLGSGIALASAGLTHTNNFHNCFPSATNFYAEAYYFIGNYNSVTGTIAHPKFFAYTDYNTRVFNCGTNGFTSYSNADESVLLTSIVQSALNTSDNIVLFYTDAIGSIGWRGIEDDFNYLTIDYYGFNLSARLTPLIPDYSSGLIVNVSVTDNETLQDSPINITPVEVIITWYANGLPTTCNGGCPVQNTYIDNTGYVVVDSVDASYLEPDVEYSVDVEVNNMGDVAFDDAIIGDPVYEEETSNIAEGTEDSLNPCGNNICESFESAFSCASDCFSGSGASSTNDGGSYITGGVVGTGLENLYTGQILTVNGAVASGVPSYSSWSFVFINRVGVGGSLR